MNFCLEFFLFAFDTHCHCVCEETRITTRDIDHPAFVQNAYTKTIKRRIACSTSHHTGSTPPSTINGERTMFLSKRHSQPVPRLPAMCFRYFEPAAHNLLRDQPNHSIRRCRADKGHLPAQRTLFERRKNQFNLGDCNNLLPRGMHGKRLEWWEVFEHLHRRCMLLKNLV